MLTIVGSGMGAFNAKQLPVDINSYDEILCDNSVFIDDQRVLKFNFKDIKEYIKNSYKSKNLLYVVSGSPLFFSGGVLIAKELDSDYVKIVDNTSCKNYLLAKLNISENDIYSISLHGRNKIDLELFLKREFTLVLCDKRSVDRIKEALYYLNEDDFKIFIGYRLGYEDEIIEQIDIFKKIDLDLTKPYILLIKREFELDIFSYDNKFVTQRGVITKKQKREFALNSLELKSNEIFWDIGAGSGSVAIEAYKRYKVKTFLFEKDPIRAENIKLNLQSHKVCDTKIFVGNAVDFFDKCKEDPNKIFIGGGGSEIFEKILYLFERLSSGGIILIHIVTLKSLSFVLEFLEKNGIKYEAKSYMINSFSGNLKMAESQRELFEIRIKK